MLQSGKPLEASEILNSELFRRLSEQRVTLRGQLAEQSSTLLDNHPRIKELKAQLADLDRQIREEASKISRSLDNDARIASGRVEGLSASLDQLKKQATRPTGRTSSSARWNGRQGAARSAGIRPREIPRGDHPREYRRRAGRRPHHFARAGIQRSSLSEEAADRADCDAGNPDAFGRRDRHRRVAAHDGAPRGSGIHIAPAPVREPAPAATFVLQPIQNRFPFRNRANRLSATEPAPEIGPALPRSSSSLSICAAPAKRRTRSRSRHRLG